jgi:hypothetical protein
VRGIIHCHSDFSFDGQNSLEELCCAFKAQGFSFVALTEHSSGISKTRYEEYVARCRKLSSDEFVLIPGLEILCPNGTEIAGIGLTELIESADPETVSTAIKRAGGFSIWVHPQKRGGLSRNSIPYGTHAIEILNGKEDGTIAPDLKLSRKIATWRREYNFMVIAGLDLHCIGAPLNVWIECSVSEVSQAGIVSALFMGNYRNVISGISFPSFGVVAMAAQIKFFCLRLLYITWNQILDVLPVGIKKFVVTISRPIVTRIK